MFDILSVKSLVPSVDFPQVPGKGESLWLSCKSPARENLRDRLASPRYGRISVAVFQVPCKGTKVFSRGCKPTDGTEGNKRGAPQGRHKAPIPVVLLPLHPYFSSSPPKPRGSPQRGTGYPQSRAQNLTLLLYRRYNNQPLTLIL